MEWRCIGRCGQASLTHPLHSPSMQVNSCATILLSMSLEATSLLGVMASISSMNKMQGALFYKIQTPKRWKLQWLRYLQKKNKLKIWLIIHFPNCK